MTRDCDPVTGDRNLQAGNRDTVMRDRQTLTCDCGTLTVDRNTSDERRGTARRAHAAMNQSTEISISLFRHGMPCPYCGVQTLR